MSNGSEMPGENTDISSTEDTENSENQPNSSEGENGSPPPELEIFAEVQKATQDISEKIKEAEVVLKKASGEAEIVRKEVKKLDDNVGILKENTGKLLEGVGALSEAKETLSAPPSNEAMAAPSVLAAAGGSTAAAGMEVAKNVKNLGFPEFTKGLIDATFDAIIGATIKQVESYSTLVEQTSKNINDFYNQYKQECDDAATQRGVQGLDIARERQDLLKEIVRMGMARVVIDSGEIETKLTFNVTTNESDTETKKRENTNTNITKVGGGARFLTWGISGSTDNTNINVSVDNTDKVSSISSQTDIMGHVKINFRTDYFPARNPVELPKSSANSSNQSNP